MESGGCGRTTGSAGRSGNPLLAPQRPNGVDAAGAADLQGRTMTDFVLHSAETAAERAIERHAMLLLTAREAEAFVDAILRPAPPGAVRKAARECRRKMIQR
jgi:uncharacterized protein (DUF1778 family)